jgi:two-component system, chemotaxis family, chemotaxis protein CheY
MKQVLIVDDSAVIRKVAKRIFEGMGFQTSEAENGRQAIAACSFLMPDAILLDWNMPVMDGFQFLRELRKMPGGVRPKVVFCSTENDVAHMARARHAGADEHVMKPFDRQILQTKFEEIGFS